MKTEEQKKDTHLNVIYYLFYLWRRKSTFSFFFLSTSDVVIDLFPIIYQDTLCLSLFDLVLIHLCCSIQVVLNDLIYIPFFFSVNSLFCLNQLRNSDLALLVSYCTSCLPCRPTCAFVVIYTMQFLQSHLSTKAFSNKFCWAYWNPPTSHLLFLVCLSLHKSQNL